MTTNRLEAFSDGVLAIIITIMVLELKVPEGHTLRDLWDTTGVGFLTYAVSFAYIGIYWNNHHHLFQLVDRVSGWVLWSNLLLLFALSVLPLTTSWMDETDLERTPVVVYGVNLLVAAGAFTVLETVIARIPDTGRRLREALGTARWKEMASLTGYVAGVALTFVEPWLGLVFFAGLALIWLVPDRRVERYLSAPPGGPTSGVSA